MQLVNVQSSYSLALIGSMGNNGEYGIVLSSLAYILKLAEELGLHNLQPSRVAEKKGE